MKLPYKTGFSFGLTSGIITTLGMMMGLYSSTHEEMVVAGGILTIAITDAFSDSIAMHMSQEARGESNEKEIWQATLSTFVAKFIFSGIFMVPVLLLELNTAIIVSIISGLVLLGIVSLLIAEEEKKHPVKLMIEHIVIAVVVLVATYFAGRLVDYLFMR